MQHHWIQAPESLTLWTAPTFCKSIQSLGAFNEYVIDFSKTRTIEPFGMLLASSELRKLSEMHPESKISCTHTGNMSYAGHMGFFKSFGQNLGKNPGQASGSRNYIPITEFDTKSLITEAATSGKEVGDVIEEQSKRLTETLLGNSNGDVFDTLSYSIR